MNEIQLIESTFLNIYNWSYFPVIFISFLFYFVLFFGIVYRKRIKYPKLDYYPFVSIHIPVYNDPIVKKCIEACLNLDYPKDKYEIIVADDSDDEKTRKIIDEYKDKVRIIRRNNREGFKAGALNNALKYSKGEIIVVFDSDSIPPKNFLKRVIPFFKDEKVALVQTKQVYWNKNMNIVSKFASTLQSIYYNFLVKLDSYLNLTFCAGSSVAIRREILEKYKWNEESVTEDADLSLKIFIDGYKTIYLDNVKTKSEVPFNLFHFLKQQARWTFGITRAFLDNFIDLLSSKNLNFIQKIYLTLRFSISFISIFILTFTFSGTILMLLGEPKPFTFDDFISFSTTFILTSGYLLLFFISAKMEKIKLRNIAVPIFLGIINLINNLFFSFKAIYSRKFYWYKTPKLGNLIFEKEK
ncbi:MAG: glycosyltransferase [Candidatus Aenigmatarchaeota archaeon]